MKLLGCHIDNFGKLADYTVDFKGNPYVINEPNGWGKSTLAAFIKVMFYGFSGESKRGATLEKERVRYKPWQGGVYGGELLFEAGGKKYLLNRTFGSKEAEDTFALYDGVTNLPSGDYSSNIGEELFQINQESFLRTVFWTQNACDTGTTDSINAKIGNLADNLDDINNYEKVQKALRDLLNSMSPTRKTGLLKHQKEEIAQLKDELRKAGAVEAAVEELETRVAACIEDRERALAERNEAQAKWEALTRRKVVEAKQTHYKSIVSKCLAKQELVEKRLADMGGRVPDREELSVAREQYKHWLEKESEASANRLQELEKAELDNLRERFAVNVPEEETIKAARARLNQLEKLRLEAAGKALDEGKLLGKKHLEERLAALAAFVGLLFAVAGAVSLTFMDRTIVIGVLCAALIMVIGGIALFLTARKSLAKLQLLTLLSEDRDKFVRLDAQEKKYNRAQAEAAKYRQQVADYLTRYNQNSKDLYGALQQLTGALSDYEKDSAEWEGLKLEREAFESANNIKDFEQDLGDITESEEKLKVQMEELEDRVSFLSEQILAYRRQSEDKQAEMEELALQRERLAQAEAEYEEKEVYYKRIGYVSEYLEKARDSLAARYIGPVLDSFRRNYELLSGESGEDFRMDANIHVTKRALGEQRETGAFSAGNRDLIHIVLRVALVDAMYQKEKPFLIIDDSFVNLDEKRLETAGRFLKQIAGDYQVIYFTCHESRVLTD